MGVIQRVVKPKNKKSKRALEDREPKTVENTKQAIFLHGQNTSEASRKCLKDFYALKKEFSMHFQKKNSILPFEDSVPLEKLSQQHDSSLFAFASHSKKRPNNIILGRMFDHHMLDMVELGLENYKSISEFSGSKVSSGTKPCLVFCGPDFESDGRYKRLKNLLIDFFRGCEVKAVRLQGFEHAIFFLLEDGKLHMRSYRILLKKSGTRIPRIELTEIGPSSTMVLRRTKLASDDLFKTACKQPKKLKPKKRKNISRNTLGTKLARIHMTKQDLGDLQTRKMPALKKNNVKRKQTSSLASGRQKRIKK